MLRVSGNTCFQTLIHLPTVEKPGQGICGCDVFQFQIVTYKLVFHLLGILGENNHNGDQFCKNKQSVYGLYADTGICGKLDDRQMIPCIGIQKQAVSTCADSNKDFSAYAVETDCKI
jgi:hypothetical protein